MRIESSKSSRQKVEGKDLRPITSQPSNDLEEESESLQSGAERMSDSSQSVSVRSAEMKPLNGEREITRRKDDN